MAKAFSSSSEAVLQQTVNITESQDIKFSKEDLIKVYELENCVEWIKEKELTKVCVRLS